MYKQAIREDYRFQTNVGELNIFQIFTSSDTTLIQLEEDLKDQVKKAKKPNRFQKSVSKDKTLKNKLSIVSDIIDTIIEEREVSANEASNKVKLQKLLELKAKKQDESLENMSIEDINKEIAELSK